MATETRAALPKSNHKPTPYSGPNREEVLALRQTYLTPGLITSYREPLLVVEGHMQYLWDEKGKQYLDAFAGIVTVSVGHCHPKIVEKVREQVGKLQHITTIYLHPTIGQFGKKLAEHMPKGSNLSVSYFTNSGSEANEVAIAFSSRVHRQFRSHQPAERLPRRHAGHDGAHRPQHVEVQNQSHRQREERAGTVLLPLPVRFGISQLRAEVCPRC